MYRLKNESCSVFSAVKRGSKKKKVFLIENVCVGSLQSGERWAPPGGDSCFSWTWAIFIEVSIGLWKRPSCVCKAKWWKARHKDFFLFFFLPVPHSLLISIYCCGFVGHLRPVPHSLHRWDQPGLRSSAERWVQHWQCSASSPHLCVSRHGQDSMDCCLRLALGSHWSDSIWFCCGCDSASAIAEQVLEDCKVSILLLHSQKCWACWKGSIWKPACFSPWNTFDPWQVSKVP